MKLVATLALFTTSAALRTRGSTLHSKQALSVRGGGVDVEQIAIEAARKSTFAAQYKTSH